MKVTAINSIILWDHGTMVVLNPGETGELSDVLAAEEIAGGNAVEAEAEAPADEAPKAKRGRRAATEAEDPAEGDDEAPVE